MGISLAVKNKLCSHENIVMCARGGYLKTERYFYYECNDCGKKYPEVEYHYILKLDKPMPEILYNKLQETLKL